MKSVAELVRELPLCRGLGQAHAALIAGCASNAVFADGAMLGREGEPCDRFFVLREGRVALEVHVPERGPRVIETLEAGETVGFSWLFPPYTWVFDARAVGAVRAIAFDGACLRGKCEADPELGFRLMQRFSQLMLERLQATRLQLLDVFGNAP